jgi:hypothetical protein
MDTATMRSILSSYPLTRDSTHLLSESGTKPRAITLSELRLLSPLNILAAVRAVDTEVLTVVVQEASEKAVLPLMLTLASLSRARRLEVRDLSAGTTVQVARIRAALGFLGTVAATISGQLSVARLNLLCRSLLRAPASKFGPLVGNKALYLKSNLMLGVKAGGSIGHIAGVANELLRLDARMQILAPEPPPLVKPDARFVPIDALHSYGVPAEVNHFRFNWNCMGTGARAMAQDKIRFHLPAAVSGKSFRRAAVAPVQGAARARVQRVRSLDLHQLGPQPEVRTARVLDRGLLPAACPPHRDSLRGPGR